MNDIEKLDLDFKIASDSMHPVMRIGQNIKFQKKLNYKTFDIILFKKDRKLTCHFIWRLQKNKTFITRSLKNYIENEAPIIESQILGTIVNFKISNLLKFKILLINFLRLTY